jgi:hypothetical protein
VQRFSQISDIKEGDGIMSDSKQSEELYRVVVKENTHLADSKDTPGANRATLLSNTNNQIVGQAELVRVDESEYISSNEYYDDSEPIELTDEQKQVAAMIGEILAAAVVWVSTEVIAPRVKHWWQTTALPSIKAIVDGTSKKKTVKLQTKASQLNVVKKTATVVDISNVFSQELDDAYKKYTIDMTSEDAQRELLEIFVLYAMLVSKIKKFSSASIHDAKSMNEVIKGEAIIAKLTEPLFIETINSIFESNEKLLEEKSKVFLSLIGRELMVSGRYIPIEVDSFKKALAFKTA